MPLLSLFPDHLQLVPLVAVNTPKLELSKGTDTLVRFSGFFYNEDNFFDFLFAFLCSKSLLKGIYSKRKESAPQANFERVVFLEKVDFKHSS